MVKETFLFSDEWSINTFIQIGRKTVRPIISDSDLESVKSGHQTLVDLINTKKWIYGVSSGFGPLSNENAFQNESRQKRLIYHLATGVGEKLDIHLVRLIFALRLKQLARGYSGINLQTFEILLQAFENDFLPEIPSLGSVGASGDLTPLAHLALGLCGKTDFFWNEKPHKAYEFSKLIPFEPIKWRDKDALAFVNGTAAMTSIVANNIYETTVLLLLSSQLAFSYGECLGAFSEAWHPKLAEIHPQEGHQKITNWLFDNSVDGWFQSETSRLPNFNDKLPQDPYSIRCIPQLLGAVYDQLKQIRKCIHVELNSVSDNPNFFPNENMVIHGGNFNGQHISFSSDQLNLQIAYLGIYSEKRISSLCDPKLNYGLPAFLKSGSEGENSGFMGAQVTATALSAELRSLYQPLSLQTLSTNGQNQDMVSMGTSSAWRGYKMLEILKAILSIELMVTTEAIRHRIKQLDVAPSEQTRAWLEVCGSLFSPLREDRPLSIEIEKMARQIIDISENFDRLPLRDYLKK